MWFDVGVITPVTINPRDWHNNPLVDDGTIEEAIPHLSVQLQGLGSNSASFGGSLTYQALTKTIGVSYNVTQAGSYNLCVKYQGQDVAGSPYKLVVSPNYAYGPTSFASMDVSPLRNITTTFRTTAVDRWGNRLRVGGNHFFIKVVGPEVGQRLHSMSLGHS